LGGISGGTDFPAKSGSGLTRGALAHAGTLNGSSPTANLAGANIKGNEAFLHFPREFAMAVLFGIAMRTIAAAANRRVCGYDINSYEASAERGCTAGGGDSLW